ncbi:MAG: Uma2 family endonuclease [Pirellulaceae bacterium]|nr:Uma2 family endonuclease [Pirellulaceae bacterium]
MATGSLTSDPPLNVAIAPPQSVAPPAKICPLVAGDRLSRDEFERRYAAMPLVKKAELIEGVVYLGSPVSLDGHGAPHGRLMGWLVVFEAHTPGVQTADNATVRLDLDNEPQPDCLLRIRPECGGQSQSGDGYVEKAPELVAEIAASSASYDLHDKLNAYRRNGVREYIVWRVWDQSIDWFVLRGGRYELLAPAGDGITRSEVFPGLWLDSAALLQGDLPRVLAILQQGVANPEHAEFVARLAAAKQPG